MCKNVQRGYAPGDQAEFGGDAVPKLRRAAQNLYYLLNQGYPIKGLRCLWATIICFQRDSAWHW